MQLNSGIRQSTGIREPYLMTTLADVRAQMAVFLAGGPFMPFWSAVMDATSIRDSGFSEAEQQWFDEAYDLVYRAGEDPVGPNDAGDGIIGASLLPTQLYGRGLDRDDAARA